MEGELKLTIELGNAAMSTDFQVAAALNQTAGKVFNGAREGAITDDNGNTVGRFELTLTEEE